MVHAGTSSVVVRRRRGSLNPRTYFSDPGVRYLSAYACSTALTMRSLVVFRARTRMRRSSRRIAPRGSSRNARYHPVGLSFQDRTKTRSPRTTAQTPVNRCSRPERSQRIFRSLTIESTRAGNPRSGNLKASHELCRRHDLAGVSRCMFSGVKQQAEYGRWQLRPADESRVSQHGLGG